MLRFIIISRKNSFSIKIKYYEMDSLILPKHIPFPEPASNISDIINETIMFFFVFFAAGMQFLHIYRTAWWLPDSYVNHTVVSE